MALALKLQGPSSGADIPLAVEVPEAEMNVAFLAVGEHVLLELLEYTNPRGESYGLTNADVGAVHVCFQVDDIHTAYEEMSAAGVVFNHPPIELGPHSDELAGYWLVYFRDPDGIQLELFPLAPGTTD